MIFLRTWRWAFHATTTSGADEREESEQSGRVKGGSFRCWACGHGSGRLKWLLLAKACVLWSTWIAMTSILRWKNRELPDDERKINVALCFFGISRSLRWTFPSIETRIFDALRREGIDYDVFVHTYNLKEINNKRNKENHVAYGNFTEDYRLLKATRTLITNQDDLDMAFPDPLALTHYTWKYYQEGTAPDVIRNVFRAYWSMMLVWEIMAEYAHENDVKYDAVVLLRPDTWYHKKIDLGSQDYPLPEDVIFLPDLSTDTAPRGRKNDRFSYGSVTAMRVLFHRIDTLFEGGVEDLTHKSLDSEYILGRHLWRHNMLVKTVYFPLSRVRMDGTVPLHDHKQVKDVCKAGLDPMACVMLEAGYIFPVNSPQEELFKLAE